VTSYAFVLNLLIISKCTILDYVMWLECKWLSTEKILDLYNTTTGINAMPW